MNLMFRQDFKIQSSGFQVLKSSICRLNIYPSHFVILRLFDTTYTLPESLICFR